MAAVVFDKSGLVVQDKLDANWWLVLNQAFGRFDARLGLSFEGNPSTHVAGYWLGQTCWDIINQIMYQCIQTGTAATTQWREIGGGNRKIIGKDFRMFFGSFEEAAEEEQYGWAISDGRVSNGFQTEDLTGLFPSFGFQEDYEDTLSGLNIVAQDGGSIGFIKTDVLHESREGGKIGRDPADEDDADPILNTNGQSNKVKVNVTKKNFALSEGGADTVVTNVTVDNNDTAHVHAFYAPAHKHLYDSRPPFCAFVPLIWVGLPGT